MCFALGKDSTEKKGQIAHLDHDPANNKLQNLVFLCLDHHDEYDSRTSQSKGLTVKEVARYRTGLYAFVAREHPPDDQDILLALMAALDRPAFRTPFRDESSLPRFRSAISETIQTLNTGKTPQGLQLPSKMQIRDRDLRHRVDEIVEALVALRATFDRLVRQRKIRHCGCGDRDCPVYMLTSDAAEAMDNTRRQILLLAGRVSHRPPLGFYDLLSGER